MRSREPEELTALEGRVQSELRLEFTTAGAGDAQGAAVEILLDPALSQRDVEECGAERAAEVRTALAPVETGKRKATALTARGLDIDAELCERSRAERCQ